MSQLSEKSRRDLFAAAEASVEEVTRAHGGDTIGKGGYFRLYHVTTPHDYTSMITLYKGWIGGSANKDKLPKYEIVSVEKAIRLMKSKRDTSWLTRNPGEGEWGGAFVLFTDTNELPDKAQSLVFSFSGLPELCDEAAMALTALRMRTWGYAVTDLSEILKTSNNELGLRLFLDLKNRLKI